MSLRRKKQQCRDRRANRVRGRLRRTTTLPRISVFRSLKHMYAQVIDDVAGKTVASASTLDVKSVKGDKSAVAHAIGQELAKRTIDAGIKTACFDRGRFLYHGRVKALADGLRAGGLNV